MLLTTNFDMTERRRRRPKVVPRAAADFVWQLKNIDPIDNFDPIKQTILCIMIMKNCKQFNEKHILGQSYVSRSF